MPVATPLLQQCKLPAKVVSLIIDNVAGVKPLNDNLEGLSKRYQTSSTLSVHHGKVLKVIVSSGFHNGEHDPQQFSHRGANDHLRRLACLHKPLGECSNCRIRLQGTKSWHVESSSHS